MRYPSHDDWVYLAGLFDGEGSLIVDHAIRRSHPSSPNFTVKVQITNTNRAVLDWIMSTFGGAVDPSTRVPLRRPCFVWRLAGAPAMVFLRRIRRHLRIKERQAWLALEAWENRGDIRRGDDHDQVNAMRQGYALAMSWLNRVG